MDSQPSSDEKTMLVAQMLTRWSRIKRPVISMEKDIYMAFFHFLKPCGTVRDKDENIIFILFPRKDAIGQIKRHYSLRTKEEINATQLHRNS